VVGVLFAMSTYVGFALLVFGSFWNANMLQKLKAIRKKWRELREGSSSGPQAAASSSSVSTVDSEPLMQAASDRV